MTKSLGSSLSGMSKPGKAHKVSLGEKGSFTIHPGRLHAKLGIPQGQKIPAAKLTIKPSDSPALAHEKASAKGLKAMHEG
jgi:hypothetical protein